MALKSFHNPLKLSLKLTYNLSRYLLFTLSHLFVYTCTLSPTTIQWFTSRYADDIEDMGIRKLIV